MPKRDVSIKIEVVGDYYTPDETLRAHELEEQVQVLLQQFCVVPDGFEITVVCDGKTSGLRRTFEGFR